MPTAIADITEPIPSYPSDPGYPTSVLHAPIFVDGGARRRRLIVRGRNLVAAACLAYLVMLGVSITASPVSRLGITAKPAPTATGTHPAATPASRPARTEPRSAPRVEIPTTKVLSDDDATRDAPLLLGMALPATPRFAVVKPPITLRPTPTSRPHHDHGGAPTTHPATISTTPIASSKPESPIPAPTRAAP